MKKTVLVLLAVCLLFSGCRGYREIDSEYLISAVCFDKAGGNFTVWAEVLDVSNRKSDSKSKVFKAAGKTPYEAVSNMAALLPKTAVFDHCGTAVIGEKTVGKDLKTVMKYLYDTKNLNLGIYIFVCSDIKKLLDCKSQAISVGYDIMAVEENIEKSSGIDFYNKYYEIESRTEQNGGFCLPEAGNKNGRPVIKGQTVFTNYTPQIKLNYNQMMMYNFIYSGSGGGAFSVAGKRCRVNSARADTSKKGDGLFIKINCKYRQKPDDLSKEIRKEIEKLAEKLKGTKAFIPLGIKGAVNSVYVEVKGSNGG